MNIGNLVAGLSMDTSGFTKGLATANTGLTGFSKSIDAAKASLVAFLTNPAVLAATAISGIIAVGKAAFDASEEINDAYDTIRIGTGATGDALDELKASFDNVFTSFPADAATVSTAIADLNTRLGVTGPELEKLATQFVELSRITQTDVGANIQNITRLYGDWNVAAADYETTLDSLFKVSQATGITIDKLATTTVQYGASLRNMGFTLEEATAMLGKFEKEGVNTETALSSMRIALAKFAEEGVDASTAFKGVIAEIQTLDETAGTARAIEVFGSRAGSDMAAAIREGRFEFEELMEAIAASDETISALNKETTGFMERVQMLGNKLMIALTPLGTSIEMELDKAFQLLNAFADNVLPHIVSFISFVQGLVAKLREPFVKVFDRIGQTIAKFWGDGENNTSDALGVILDIVVVSVDRMATAIDWFFENAWPIIEWGLANIIELVKMASDLISGDWDSLWNRLLKATSNILQAIVDVIFTGLNAVVDFFEGFINTIIDGINSVLAGINSITGMSLGMLSDVSLHLDTPDISQMLGVDAGRNGVAVTQNITINGDVTNPSKLYAEEEKLAYVLGQGVAE